MTFEDAVVPEVEGPFLYLVVRDQTAELRILKVFGSASIHMPSLACSCFCPTTSTSRKRG